MAKRRMPPGPFEVQRTVHRGIRDRRWVHAVAFRCATGQGQNMQLVCKKTCKMHTKLHFLPLSARGLQAMANERGATERVEVAERGHRCGALRRRRRHGGPIACLVGDRPGWMVHGTDGVARCDAVMVRIVGCSGSLEGDRIHSVVLVWAHGIQLTPKTTPAIIFPTDGGCAVLTRRIVSSEVTPNLCWMRCLNSLGVVERRLFRMWS